jgi:hypothetical protein
VTRSTVELIRFLRLLAALLTVEATFFTALVTRSKKPFFGAGVTGWLRQVEAPTALEAFGLRLLVPVTWLAVRCTAVDTRRVTLVTFALTLFTVERTVLAARLAVRWTVCLTDFVALDTALATLPKRPFFFLGGGGAVVFATFGTLTGLRLGFDGGFGRGFGFGFGLLRTLGLGRGFGFGLGRGFAFGLGRGFGFGLGRGR